LEDSKKEEELFFGKMKARIQVLSAFSPQTTPTTTEKMVVDKPITSTQRIDSPTPVVANSKEKEKEKEKTKENNNNTTTTLPLDQNRFFTVKLERMLVDFMLREGLYQTASLFAKQTHIEELVDLEIFNSAKKVIEGLQQRNCKEALKWCADNKSKLKKIESDLEFNLLVQEFVEIARTGASIEAIEYARKSFTPFVQTNASEIQLAMGLLVFSKDTNFSSRYDV